jgi:hypothetical protein
MSILKSSITHSKNNYTKSNAKEKKGKTAQSAADQLTHN